MRIQALGYLTLNAIKGTTADKQDVTCIDGDILLVRMLTTALRWNVHVGTLQEFQQALLHALATDITRNRRIIRLTGNLVDLVNEHDTALGCLHIIVSHLQQSRKNTFHVLTYIASLSKHCRINNGERHIQQFGNGTCQQRLTRTRRAHHDDV